MSVYDKKKQEELFRLIENGDISNAIKTMIDCNAINAQKMKGLYRRSRLDSASVFDWPDPRYADGVPIFARESPGVTKVNHRNHTPFDKTIAKNKASYLTGNMPEITYPDENKASVLLDKIKPLNLDTNLTELCKRSTYGGSAYLLLSSPPGNLDVYATLPNPWECVIVYHPVTNTPVYAFRYWVEGTDKSTSWDVYICEFYTQAIKQVYSGTLSDGFSGHVPPELHLLGVVPLIEFPNNRERLGDVELTLSLQDAYDVADSDLSSEISQLRLAYLLLQDKEGGDIDEEWLNQLRQTGILAIVDGDARFVEKNINAVAVENLKKDLEQRIYRYSNSYNPDQLGADKALTAFQINQMLFNLEASATDTEAEYRQALRQVIAALSHFYSLGVNPDDVSIAFPRKTPRNVTQDIKDMVQSGYQLSQKRLAALSPLDVDQGKNEEELAEEMTAIELPEIGQGAG